MSYSDLITQDQLDYIYILIRQGWLSKEDFPTSKSYYRKKTLTRGEADQLIKKGCYEKNYRRNSYTP
jgi:hypothetical protein